MDVELAIDASEMGIHRPGADEQPRCGLLVGDTGGHESRDLDLLRGQLVGGDPIASASGLASRRQLLARQARPRLGTEPLERRKCGAQALSRLDAPTVATEALPVRKFGAR